MSGSIPRVQPIVTVVIPVHNYASYLPKAVESLHNQTYPYIAVVMVDDGSTDNSWEVIQKLVGAKDAENDTIIQNSLTDKRLLIGIKLPAPTGPANARNVGILHMEAMTDIYGFLDADDWWHPEKVEKSIAQFHAHPSRPVGLVYSDNETVNEVSGMRIREYREPFDWLRLLQHNMIHNGSMVSAKALRKVGLFDSEMRVAEDYDLWIRIAEQFGVVHIPEALAYNLIHESNTTNKVDMRIWQQNWQRIGMKLQQRHGSKQ